MVANTTTTLADVIRARAKSPHDLLCKLEEIVVIICPPADEELCGTDIMLEVLLAYVGGDLKQLQVFLQQTYQQTAVLQERLHILTMIWNLGGLAEEARVSWLAELLQSDAAWRDHIGPITVSYVYQIEASDIERVTDLIAAAIRSLTPELPSEV